MRGHIRQRSKGSWEFTIDAGTEPTTGRRQRHFETVKGAKKDAQKRLAELLVSMEKGSYVRQPKQLTVAAWLRQWLASMAAERLDALVLRGEQKENVGKPTQNECEPWKIRTSDTPVKSRVLCL